MNPTKPAEPDPDALRPLSGSEESLLIRLVDEFTAASRRGDTPDIETLARQHPELADELRSLWATILVAEALGRERERPRGHPEIEPHWPIRRPPRSIGVRSETHHGSRASLGPASRHLACHPLELTFGSVATNFSKSSAKEEWGSSSVPGS